MDRAEKLKKHNRIYDGKVLKYNVDEVTLPNGKTGIRETVNHPGGVGILAIKDGYVYLEKQFRYVFGKDITEIPAGKLEKNEDPKLAAKRELKEEIGAVTDNLQFLGEFYPSVGYTDEVIHLFLAENFEFENQDLDDDEFLDFFKMPLKQFAKEIKENKIKDGKTIAAFHLYSNK